MAYQDYCVGPRPCDDSAVPRKVDVAVAIQKVDCDSPWVPLLTICPVKVVVSSTFKQVIGEPLFDRPLPERRALMCAGGLFVDDVAEGFKAQGFGVFSWDIHRLMPRKMAAVCNVSVHSLYLRSAIWSCGMPASWRTIDCLGD